MAAPPRFMNSVYDAYPDDDATKPVQLQAAGLSYGGTGDRHVLIWWSNGTITTTNSNETKNVSQIIQLTGQAGNYSYYYPVAQAGQEVSITANFQVLLGEFTRKERERILEIASVTKFERGSVVNGCRVWTRDLMEAMVREGLISKEKFEEADREIPLVKRRPEV